MQQTLVIPGGTNGIKVKENDVRERVTTGCSNFVSWNESVAVLS